MIIAIFDRVQSYQWVSLARMSHGNTVILCGPYGMLSKTYGYHMVTVWYPYVLPNTSPNILHKDTLTYQCTLDIIRNIVWLLC